MNRKTIFPALVQQDLTLKFVNIVPLKNHLLQFRGQMVAVTVDKLRKKRSSDQNRYYWGVVIEMIAAECGYRSGEEKEAIHLEMKRRFLPTNGPLRLPASTEKLSTAEFAEYVEAVKRWAAEYLKIYIPEPNEVDY